jgi:hypothetical protein
VIAALALLIGGDGSDGIKALAELDRVLFDSGSGLYREAVGKSEPAFNWSVGIVLSALNAAARRDQRFREPLRRYAERTRVYWNPLPPVPGYDVLPAPKPVDRYYDDNAWMVLALVETYEILRDRKYLNWAQETVAYCLSGESDAMGGGIYWRESDRGATKNTCSNGPVAAALLALHRVERRQEYLDAAKRLYDWTRRTLQDPDDGLMWDAIRRDGSIDRTKWSYNTALMITSAVELARATGETSYRHQARRMLDASRARWLDPNTGAMKDEGQFAHLLLESWNVAAKAGIVTRASHERDISAALGYMVSTVRRADGIYGKRWDGPTPAEFIPTSMHQASAARVLLLFGR